MPSRERTITDHKERINRVLLYIQEDIAGPLSLEILSEVASFSPFHFHRLFQAHVGETLRGYVRRVRLERAALRLSHTKETVTFIALSAGYETPAAFTKAFRHHFGKTPTAYKGVKEAELHPTLPGLNVAVKDAKCMQPDIRTLPEHRVLFVRKTGRYGKAASEAWGVLMKFAYSRGLIGKETMAIGISHDSPDITPEDSIRYDACITIDRDVKPEGELGVKTMGVGRHAVFMHKGPYAKFDETYNAIFSGWLPACGEELRDAPCFEVYLNRSPQRTKPENLRTEIFIPVM